MQAIKRFSTEALNKLRSEIEAAGGNEVFALGYFGEGKLVSNI